MVPIFFFLFETGSDCVDLAVLELAGLEVRDFPPLSSPHLLGVGIQGLHHHPQP